MVYLHRWIIPSDWKPTSDMGKWDWTAGEWYGDEEDKGIKTSQDAKFYGIFSTALLLSTYL